jgi:uncharacterized protein YkwD
MNQNRFVPRFALAGLLAAAFVLLLPSLAQAASLTVHVVNDRGTDQSGTSVLSGSSEVAKTAYNGQVTLNSVSAGQTYRFARHPDTIAECQPPEGATGVAYTVPSPVPNGTVTVTVPAISFASFEPAVDDDERYLVGRINQERARLGVAPLEISTKLSSVSDAFANHLVSTSQFDHCVSGQGGPSLRAIDAGYPFSDAPAPAENATKGPSDPEGAFINWMNSPGHHDLMTSGLYRVIGIGHRGDLWITDFGKPCTVSMPGYSRCQMTGDTGDPNLPIFSPNTSYSIARDSVMLGSDSPAPVDLEVKDVQSSTVVASHRFPGAQTSEYALSLPPGVYQYCFDQASSGNFKGYSHCEQRTWAVAVWMSIPRPRSVAGRAVSTVTVDPNLIGQVLHVSFHRDIRRSDGSWRKGSTTYLRNLTISANTVRVDLGSYRHDSRIRAVFSTAAFSGGDGTPYAASRYSKRWTIY